MFGNINWEVAIDTALGTIADRENEIRKTSSEILRTIHKDRAEQITELREKNRLTKKEIDRTNSTLKSAGLTSEQIAAGLDTMGKNFYKIVDQEISALKNSKFGAELLANDKTGAEFREYVHDKFDEKLVSDDQRKLDLSDVVESMLDKLPEQTEMRNIPQSLFGVDYNKGIREEIKGLGKEFSNVPDYDSVAPLEGVDTFLSSGVPTVPEEAMFTSAQLDKRIKNLIKARYGNLVVDTAGNFTTTLQDKQKESELVAKAQREFNSLRDKYTELRGANKRVLTEGGKTDAEILRDADAALTSSVAGDKKDAKDDLTGLDQFNIRLSAYIDQFSGSKIAGITEQLKDEDIGFDDAQVASILQGVSQGKTAREILKTIPDGPPRERIIKLLKTMTTEDKEIIKGFGTVTESTKQTENPETTDGGDTKEAIKLLKGAIPKPEFQNNNKQRERDFREAWDDTYGQYLNDDGTLQENITEETFKSAMPLVDKTYENRRKAILSFNPFD